MGREICPIFNRDDGEKITLVGAWMMHPVNLKIVPDYINFMELGHIGPMAASYFRNEPHRQVPNSETDVGRGCRFVGGSFLMGHDHPAPNEKGGSPGVEFDYAMKDNGGVTICVREKKATPKETSPPSETRSAETGPAGTATAWFKEASVRGGPNTPSDFNLFEIPRYSLQEWAQQVSAYPRRVQCTVLSISKVGSVTQALFDAIKRDHDLSSAEAVKTFDEYLGAACPKCFGGLTGSLLQMVSASSKMAAVVGGGAQFQRILGGRCANCESDTYYIVWHGDKVGPSKSGGEEVASARGTPSAAAKQE